MLMASLHTLSLSRDWSGWERQVFGLQRPPWRHGESVCAEFLSLVSLHILAIVELPSQTGFSFVIGMVLLFIGQNDRCPFTYMNAQTCIPMPAST